MDDSGMILSWKMTLPIVAISRETNLLSCRDGGMLSPANRSLKCSFKF